MSDVNKQLLEALKALFASYKRLADSGDSGYWRIEDYPEGKQALEAIAAAEQAQQASSKCATCRGVGIVGHSDVCMDCIDTWQQGDFPAQQAEPLRITNPSPEQLYTMVTARFKAGSFPWSMVSESGKSAWAAAAAELVFAPDTIMASHAPQPAQQQAQPRCACGDSFTSDAVCANCLAAQPQAEPVARDWPKIDAFMRDYVEGYEMIGDNNEVCYSPTKAEQELIIDCVRGLLTESDFIDMLTAQPPAVAVPDGVARQTRPDCPLPCGWEKLHQLALEDQEAVMAAFEEGATVPRDAAVRAITALTAVCRAMLAAAQKGGA